MASGHVRWGYSALRLVLKRLAFSNLPLNLSHSIHGINEKISVRAYETQVKFIFEFIQNADTDQEPVPHLHEL